MVALQGAVVKRIDNALGAVLELTFTSAAATSTSEPAETTLSAIGFAHISNIADKRVDKLDKTLKVNSKAKARVLGFRPFEGIATVTLKPSVVDKAFEGIKDLQPGGIVSGTVSSVEDFGLLVSLTSNLR